MNFATEWLDEDGHIGATVTVGVGVLTLLFFLFKWLARRAPAAAPPPPVINFATEWLDECNRICPKTVDYATQCPKGHVLVPFADGGGNAPVQRLRRMFGRQGGKGLRLMCRICHGFTEREHARQWLVCSVAGCCAGYAVCDTCASALQQAPAAAAASHDFPSLVRAVAQQRSHL